MLPEGEGLGAGLPRRSGALPGAFHADRGHPARSTVIGESVPVLGLVIKLQLALIALDLARLALPPPLLGLPQLSDLVRVMSPLASHSSAHQFLGSFQPWGRSKGQRAALLIITPSSRFMAKGASASRGVQPGQGGAPFSAMSWTWRMKF